MARKVEVRITGDARSLRRGFLRAQLNLLSRWHPRRCWVKLQIWRLDRSLAR